MAIFHRGGVSINYEVIGESGDWIVLTPGGRSGLEDVRDLADALSAEGYRVLLHDRRNCGKSDVSMPMDHLQKGVLLSEQELWVDDVHALLTALNALPVIAGGGSAGCRLSLLLALKYPGSVRGLLLWWVTGGEYAARFLAGQYYGQFIKVAGEQGMQGVCETEFFAERIAENPENRALLLKLNKDDFIQVMTKWQDFFLEGADLPVIGATEAELATIKVPTIIIPGSDEVHPRKVAVHLQSLIEGSELRYPFDKEELPAIKRLTLDEILGEFRKKLARHFVDFVRQQQTAGRW